MRPSKDKLGEVDLGAVLPEHFDGGTRGQGARQSGALGRTVRAEDQVLGGLRLLADFVCQSPSARIVASQEVGVLGATEGDSP